MFAHEEGGNWLSLTKVGTYVSQTPQGEAGVALPYGLMSVRPSVRVGREDQLSHHPRGLKLGEEGGTLKGEVLFLSA